MEMEMLFNANGHLLHDSKAVLLFSKVLQCSKLWNNA